MKQIGGVTFFRDAADFREWLAEHHDSAPELWMGLVKKALDSPPSHQRLVDGQYRAS